MDDAKPFVHGIWPMRAVPILLLTLCPALSAATLGGDYKIEGRNPDGSRYTGTLSVAPVGRAWRLIWDASTKTGGIGLLLDSTLVVAIGQQDCAVAGFVKNRGGMNGLWALPGVGALGTERAQAKADVPQGLAGDYEVFGTRPDATVYRGALTLESKTDHWIARWRIDGESDTSRPDGFGLVRGKNLAVTWGAADCGVAMYRVAADGSLSGIWQHRGSDAIGTETAQR